MLQYRYRSSTGGNPSLYISTDDRTADGFRCYKNHLNTSLISLTSPFAKIE